MIIKELTSTREYKTFIKKFCECVNPDNTGDDPNVSIEYLKRSHTVAAFNNHGEMVAGYILGFNQPFRLPTFVPSNYAYKFPEGFSFQECAEIVCMWKIRGKVSKLFMVNKFWPHIFDHFLKSGKKFLLGHNQNVKLDKHYRFFGPKTLYAGPSIYNLKSRLFFYDVFKIRLLNSYIKTFHSLFIYIRSIKMSSLGARDTL